jgi:hypothetical protein
MHGQLQFQSRMQVCRVLVISLWVEIWQSKVGEKKFNKAAVSELVFINTRFESSFLSSDVNE